MLKKPNSPEYVAKLQRCQTLEQSVDQLRTELTVLHIQKMRRLHAGAWTLCRKCDDDDSWPDDYYLGIAYCEVCKW